MNTEGKRIANAALRLVSFALFCAMLRFPYFGSIYPSGVEGIHLGHLAADASVLIASVAIYFMSWRKLLPSALAISLLGTILTVCGAGSIVYAQALPLPFTALVTVASVSMGAGIALLGLAIMQSAVGFAAENKLPLLMIAFVGGLLVCAAGEFLDWKSFPSAILIPLLSGSTLCIVYRDKGNADDSSSSACPQSAPTRFDRWDDIIVGLLFVEVLVFALIRGTWTHGGVEYVIRPHSFQAYLLTALLGLGIAFVLWKAKSVRNGFIVSSALSIALFLGSACLFATGDNVVSSVFITSSQTVIQVTLILLLASHLALGRGNICRSAALAMGLFGSGSLIGYDIVPALFDYQITNTAALPVAFIVMLLMCVWFAVSLALVIRGESSTPAAESSMAASEQQAPTIRVVLKSTSEAQRGLKEPEEQVDIAQQLIKSYGLTQREAEVALLIADGYTQKRAADELHLAYSTVQGYVKVIYAKMGIHNRNQLVDIARGEKLTK